jgi:TolB-like protein
MSAGYKFLLAGFIFVLLAGCSTIHTSGNSYKVQKGEKWIILPIANHSMTPQAGLSAESILEPILRRHGVASIAHYPTGLNNDTLFEPTGSKDVEEATRWALQHNITYGITGAVEEWHYKAGIDGEPAVGITLQVIDLKNKQVLWSAAGSDSGWSRSTVGAVAQKLMSGLIDQLPLVALPGQ